MKANEKPEAVALKLAASADDYEEGVRLFKEYASELGVDLTFQRFDEELQNIATEYGAPGGALILATDQQHPVGCVGVRKLEAATGELKRMYIRKAYRGRGLGELLLKRSIDTARRLGYAKMRLDTLPFMESAAGLYRKTGFYEIAPYRYNPIPGTRYFEIDLTAEKKADR